MRRTAAALLVAFGAASAFAVDGELARMAKDSDSFKRSDAARKLGKDGSVEAAKLLAELLEDRNPYVRDYTVLAIADLAEPKSIAVIARRAKSKDELLKRNVAASLGATKQESALEALAKLATDRSAPVRCAALDALWGFRENAEALELCRAAAADSDPLVRAAAAEAVGRIRSPVAMEVLAPLCEDEDAGVRAVARMEMTWVAPEEASAGLAVASKDAAWQVRAQVVDDGFKLRDAASVDVLVGLLADERLRVAVAAHRALIGLSGKEFGRDVELWRSWWEANRATWDAPRDAEFGAPPEDSGATTARYHGVEVLGDRVVFVLDGSGSMRDEMEAGKTRWDVARAELESTLAALPDGQEVNVVIFQEQIQSAFDAPKPLGKGTRKKLDTFLRRSGPKDAGNLLDGVLTAIEQDDVDTIYLLSDGAPSFGESTVKSRVRAAIRARNRSRKIALNCIGFGAKKSTERAFLTGVSKDGSGLLVFR